MNTYFTIFGSHPDLSLAELLSVEPKLNDLHLAGPKAAVFESEAWDSGAMMGRLGGTVKLGQIALDTTLDALDFQQVANLISSRSKQGNKIQFGWTVFGTKQNQKLENFPLKIKKVLKSLGFPSRWVTGENSQELSPAAVAKCKLTQEPNADVCVFVIKDRVLIGFTSNVQDADAWSLRDYGRPCRDDVNGMLPPKLARMMVNLAPVPENGTLLDPFCGSGTVLMEAALATTAKKIIGSDIDAKQITDTQTNLVWLEKQKIIREEDGSRFQTFISDVRLIAKHLPAKSVDAIVTEGWLGPPLKGRESIQDLKNNAAQISQLWADALKVLRPILKDNASVVAVFPSFRYGNQMISTLTDLDLASLGYKLDELPTDIKPEELYYERSGQHLRRNIRRLVKA